MRLRERYVGAGFTELANGFTATDHPHELQQICGTLGSGAMRVFCQ